MNKRKVPRGLNVHYKSGRGIGDYVNAGLSFMNTNQEFEGEKHAVGIEGDYKGKLHQWLGPGTNIDKRLQRGDQGISDLDKTAKLHDLGYKKIGDDYKKGFITKSEAIKKVHNEDTSFINEARRSRDEPKLGNIAANAINLKMNSEKIGVLPTRVFSGVGKNEDKYNPAERLIEEAMKLKKKEVKKNIFRNNIEMPKKQGGGKKAVSKKVKSGGFLPFLIPLLSAVAGPLISEGVKKLTGGKKRKPMRRK